MVLSALYTFEDCPLVCGCSHSLQGLSLYATMSLHLITCQHHCPEPATSSWWVCISLVLLLLFPRLPELCNTYRSWAPLCPYVISVIPPASSVSLLTTHYWVAAWISCCISFFLTVELCATSRNVLLWAGLGMGTSFRFILFFFCWQIDDNEIALFAKGPIKGKGWHP